MNEKLDQVVIDIEFLLISVVQGVALAALASSATPVVASLKFEYWPYIISGFLFILIFWSQAIMHVIGFIRWPIDMIHNFIYFLASLIEVIAFSEMENPLFWFMAIFIFVVVSALLYLYDFKMMNERKQILSKTLPGKELFNDLIKEQSFYIRFVVPSGLIFNLGCILLIHRYPAIFIEQHFHLILIGLQIFFALGILFSSLKTFNRRLKLIQKSELI